MSAWFPASPCDTACIEGAEPPADGSSRRRTALSGDLGRVAARLLVSGSPGSAVPRRELARAAADLLTALGVRVEVIARTSTWPRRGEGRLLVANHISWLDELALLSVVAATPVAKAEIANWPLVGLLARLAGALFVDRGRLRSLPAAVAAAEERMRRGETVLVHPEGTTACGAQLGRFRRAFFQAAVDAAVPVCPVAIRYRLGDEPTTVPAYVGDESLWRSLARVLAARGLVVELHVLPPLDPAGADRRVLAALAEYAIADVTEADPPLSAAHPPPVRRPHRAVTRSGGSPDSRPGAGVTGRRVR